MAFTTTNFLLVSPGGSTSPNAWSYNAGADSLATIAAANYFNPTTFPVLNDIRSGDRVWINTTTYNLCFMGTFLVNAGAITVAWDNTYYVQGQFANISGAASTIYFPFAPAGVVVKTFGTQFNAVTVASANISFSIGGVAITGAGFAVPTAGVAGTNYSGTPSALNITNGASVLSATSDGGSTTACILTVAAKIICGVQQ